MVSSNMSKDDKELNRRMTMLDFDGMLKYCVGKVMGTQNIDYMKDPLTQINDSAQLGTWARIKNLEECKGVQNMRFYDKKFKECVNMFIVLIVDCKRKLTIDYGRIFGEEAWVGEAPVLPGCMTRSQLRNRRYLRENKKLEVKS